MEQSKKYIRKCFKTHPINVVTFTKVNGEKRELVGTINLDIIPEEYHPNSEKRYTQSDEVFIVFDLENQGWRSFRIDSLISIERTT